MTSVSLAPVLPSGASALRSSCQLLLVLAADWESRTATLLRFERERRQAAWQRLAVAVPVTVGRAGLAWGRGLHEVSACGAPEKREGDGRAPAGIFPITALFGDVVPDSPWAAAAKLPYLPATDNLKAVDDPDSTYYNQIVDQSVVLRPDWTSCEDMRRTDQRYAVGAVVGHNVEPTVPGAGSCIFLHVWAGAGVPTAGCTAMSLADMGEIAGWLEGAARPLLVQLPLVEYGRWQAAWELPTLPAGIARGGCSLGDSHGRPG